MHRTRAGTVLPGDGAPCGAHHPRGSGCCRFPSFSDGTPRPGAVGLDLRGAARGTHCKRRRAQALRRQHVGAALEPWPWSLHGARAAPCVEHGIVHLPNVPWGIMPSGAILEPVVAAFPEKRTCLVYTLSSYKRGISGEWNWLCLKSVPRGSEHCYKKVDS